MKPGFQLRISRNIPKIMISLGVSVVFTLLFFLVFLQRALAFYGSLSQILALLFFGGLLLLSLFLNFYFYRLTEAKKNRSALVFGEKEWKDSISMLFLGHRSLSDIHNTRVSEWAGVEFLILDLNPSVFEPLRARLFCRLYLKIFGQRIFIPLAFLDITRLDLESQFLHLENLIEKGSVSVDDKEESTAVATKTTVSAKSIFSHLSGEKPAPAPEPRHPVLKEVARRKEEFKEKGLDVLVCELFYDHLRFLPAWSKNPSHRIPEGLELLGHRQEDHDYEEVGFRWDERNFQMGLRTNLGENPEALLSLAVGGDVKVSLRVGVEIGTLDPRDLERYIAGSWEESLFKLEKALKRPTKGEGSEAREEGAPEENTQKIDELKRNFGLKDD